MKTHGTLVKWNEDRGFGFVSVATGGEEVFVHISEFPRDGQRPQVGELISFELKPGADGRRKAVRVKRPGSRPARRTRSRTLGRDGSASPMGRLLGGLAVASLVAMLVFGYVRWMAPDVRVSEASVASPFAGSEPAGPVFQCDGRVHCSEMKSCDEARYFSKNCPGTQMDGDFDGEPCEQQLCN